MAVIVGQTVCKNRPDINLADCSLQNSLHGKNLLDLHQSGFRTGHSTETALLAMMEVKDICLSGRHLSGWLPIT
ncbi:hypothetical protein SKAU_G00139310 [Synaphobranchus kaupii]|uniref:Uncharacterized protein n=1 Tax=Synaphobranchus kaupii TaxID=118154 RepID=A0A9Q1FSS4_SYNKA|nr:hypothetical protein SKAU_G00139310 [Synaphobranchus kaupii]